MGGMKSERGARAARRRARRHWAPQRWGIVAAAYIGCVIIFWTFDMAPRKFAGCGAVARGGERATFAAAHEMSTVRVPSTSPRSLPPTLQRELVQLVEQAAAARHRSGRRRKTVASLTPWSRLLPAGLASSVRIARRRRQAAAAPVAAGQRFVLEAPPPAAAPAAADADDDGETLDDIFGGLANARATGDAKRQAAEEAERARSEAGRRRRRRSRRPSVERSLARSTRRTTSTRRTPRSTATTARAGCASSRRTRSGSAAAAARGSARSIATAASDSIDRMRI